MAVEGAARLRLPGVAYVGVFMVGIELLGLCPDAAALVLLRLLLVGPVLRPVALAVKQLLDFGLFLILDDGLQFRHDFVLVLEVAGQFCELLLLLGLQLAECFDLVPER